MILKVIREILLFSFALITAMILLTTNAGVLTYLFAFISVGYIVNFTRKKTNQMIDNKTK